MVSRRTRGYKEKKPMATFGRFMLPLAVVMMIALLYFSIKLFFLTPGETKNRDIPVQPVATVPVEPVQPAVITQPAVPAQDKPSANRFTAGPVTATPLQATPKPAQTREKLPAQPKLTVTKPPVAAAVRSADKTDKIKPTTAITLTAQTANVLRYDVQIGAFTAKDNALQLAREARGRGYDSYVNEAIHNNQPYFRVRVKGQTDRTPTQELSAKLQKNNYPVYIVPIVK